MTSDKRLPVGLLHYDALVSISKGEGKRLESSVAVLAQAILQITRPAGDVAENATTANLSNSTPLPEHFQSFHADCDTENHDVIRALTHSNDLLLELHGMLFFQNTAHLKRQKLEMQIRENQAALKEVF